jgi:hypothetical protein
MGGGGAVPRAPNTLAPALAVSNNIEIVKIIYGHSAFYSCLNAVFCSLNFPWLSICK